MGKKRPSWDEYFIGLCEAVRERATCDRGRNGVVIVRDKQVLVTGYVGSPPGAPHCDEVGHQLKAVTHEDGRTTWHCRRTTHAEMNAIFQAAKRGIALKGSTLYTLMEPCYDCAKGIVTVGIERVVCKARYHDSKDSEELLRRSGIRVDYLSNEVVRYEKQ
ncbi:cell division protein DedD [Candidatus Pacearchaeota archaeon]|nr:MAG: cell division protein DedD [Candidatus Pacearchaeota archaeon]